MDILLCGSFDDAERDEWLDALRSACPDANWYLSPSADEAQRIEAAVVANPPPGALRHLPNLRLIQSLWAGVDRLMLDASLPAGVPVARMVDPAMNQAMAQTAVWATLSLHRGFFRYAAQQQATRWQQWPQRRADEVRVTILGLGQMGRCCASRLAGLGYTVAGWSSRPTELDGIETCNGNAALQGLLQRTDILINLLPLTPQTEGLLDTPLLNALPRGAGLVNLARGAHLVEDALLEALDSGQIGHAVLDVFHHEPLPAEHPFWRHPNVTVLPHVAAMTDARSAASVVAQNLRALRDGRPLANLVDPTRGY
ncbi:glyoxylate/hydroxypyruvate reductase A [Stutzerimonas stutzeri]